MLAGNIRPGRWRITERGVDFPPGPSPSLPPSPFSGRTQNSHPLPSQVVMTPRKAAARHRPLPTSQVPLESSEHEFVDPTLDPPLPPPHLSTRTNLELNLSVLQRYLPATESILLIAPYAALYTFEPSAEEWEKSNIQGTLFVVHLQTPPFGPGRYAIIILNRLGLKNFILELRPGANVDLENEIVVVRGGAEADDMICGLWIYEEGENKSTAGMRDEVEGMLRSCVEASQVEWENDNGSDLGNKNYSAHGDGGYTNGTYISPIDVFTDQQQEDHPVLEPAPDPSLVPQQTQSQPEQDILGALFHRAMLNYRGS